MEVLHVKVACARNTREFLHARVACRMQRLHVRETLENCCMQDLNVACKGCMSHARGACHMQGHSFLVEREC